MKKLFVIMMAAIVGLGASAAEKMSHKKMDWDGTITGISLVGPFDVKVETGAKKEYLDVVATEKGLEYLNLKVKNNTLYLSIESTSTWNQIWNNPSNQYSQFTLYVAQPLTSIEICGTGDVIGTTFGREGEDLSISVVGTGDLKATNLVGDKINISVAGTGDVKANKATASRKALMSVAGTGDVEIKYVTAPKLSVSVAGAGEVDVNCYDTEDGILDASVSGTGDVEIEGINCAEVNASVSGTGDIELQGTTPNAYLSANGTGTIKAKRLRANRITAEAGRRADIYVNSYGKLIITGDEGSVHIAD
ncbi:MAG: DUF2807 domain-containing protein [Bacteroidales bacterium]|nr:DUF2807 domain-containing protein [Bacteroidales bacterium]